VTMGEALLLKVEAEPPCTGTTMPPTGSPVPESEVKLLEQWIEAGYP